MILNKLDACHCDSVKLVKETLSQMKRPELRENRNGAKKLIESLSELLKENLCIPRKFLPNCNG